MTEQGDLVTIEDFRKVQLKTAKVISAQKPEGADKLLVLKVDLGGEERQIVAGIGPWYSAEDLVGKTIVVVSNLKPATIRGHESKGMLLAATHGADLALLTLDRDLPPGAAVS